jgi:6-pyruvoyltetrahydropterin/6-carboxytetrahydropterin synthase
MTSRGATSVFELSVKTHFSAAHHLRGYEGLCANPHGHNWEVEVFLRGEDLDGVGFLVDFRDIKSAVRTALSELDHHDINTLPAFTKENPTSERLARYIFDSLSRSVNCRRYRVHKITVWETPGNAASYWEGA